MPLAESYREANYGRETLLIRSTVMGPKGGVMRALRRVRLHTVRLCLGLLPLLLGGCTTEKLVFRDPFNPPPDNTFLGFFDVSKTQTTCGNCHVLHQRDWVNTKHASAIDELVGNADATPACYQCHTVSERGNPVDGAAGYNSVQTDVYHDVQCESCHGPGLDHVEAPDAGQTATNPPLAAIAVPLLSAPLNSTDSTTLANSASCGSCHNQNSGPGVRTYEEWALSGHSDVVREPDGSSPAEEAGCNGCHEAKGALEAWGVFVNFREKGTSTLLGQTCAVCHDPHGARKDENGQPFPGQLRYSMDTPDTNANLCMKCHQRRAVPAATSSRGPHSPQGPMLLGDAGYRPVGFDPNVVQTTHASDRNPRLCAGCHVNRLTGTDVNTGKPAVSAGHHFMALPCLDAGGLPDLANLEDCPLDETSRSWQACIVCHNSAAQSLSLFNLITQRMTAYTDQIWIDLNANGLVDPDSTACSAGALRIRVEGDPAVTDTIPCANPTGVTATDDYNRANWDDGLLARTDLIPQIGPTAAFPNDTNQYALNDSYISPAEGALFNVRMLRPEGGSDGSHGVHNPFLAEALLIADIAEINTRYYGGAAALSPAVRSKMSGGMAGLYRSVVNAASVQSK